MNSANRSPILSAIVNSFTGLNLILGMTALFAATLGHPRLAAWCLLSSVAFDAVDGFFARMWGVSSEFGAQFDSLADLTSFIIGGSVITFHWFSPGLPLVYCGAAACLYALTGACRLARFNSGAKVDGEFQGMPTTAMAALVGFTYLTYPQLNCQWGACLVVMCSLLMVSNYPYPKWNRIAAYPWWFFAGLALGGIFCFKLTVWACSIGYILSGPAVWLNRRVSP